MTHRINGRGTIRLDRMFKGIGRVARATGTNDKATAKAIDVMLTTLYQTARWDIVREIKDGIVTPLEVYSYYIKGELDNLPSTLTLQSISPAFEDWVKTHTVEDKTKKDYVYCLKALISVVGNVKIFTLGDALGTYRTHCIAQDTARMFNSTRTALLSYCTNALGADHPVRASVASTKKLKEVTTPPKQLTVVEAVETLDALPKEHKSMARTMLFTGMSWKELNGKWELLEDRLVIHGTKTKGRVRTIPRMLDQLAHPTRSLSQFKRELKKANPGISPNSFRRTFGNWMAEAGIPQHRRSRYMGHGVASMTERYERGEVERYLVDDAKLFSEYVQREWDNRHQQKEVNIPSHDMFKLVYYGR